MSIDYTTDARLDPTGDYHTASGLPVWYLEPWRTPIRPADLFTHLANARRYAGALDCPILMHLALCVQIGRELGYQESDLQILAAHDMHEAYVGDIPTMFKRVLRDWKPIEHGWELRVHEALGLPLPSQIGPATAAMVKRIDLLALHAEMTVLGHPAAPLVTARANGEGVDRGIRAHGVAWAVPEDLATAERVVRIRPTHPRSWWEIVTDALPQLIDRRPICYLKPAGVPGGGLPVCGSTSPLRTSENWGGHITCPACVAELQRMLAADVS